LSATVQALLKGTAAEQFLDHALPRSTDAVPEPPHIAALRNAAIQYAIESTERWDLSTSAGTLLPDEIANRSEALARGIAAHEQDNGARTRPAESRLGLP
jgi:hypothetical protein